MNLKKFFLWGKIAILILAIPTTTYAQPMQLTATDSIHLALQHSPTLKIANAETSKYDFAIAENRANFLPKLTADYTQSNNHSESSGSEKHSSTSINATTILYSGGLNEALVAQAKELYSGAKYQLDYTKQQVITDTYLNYYNILQAKKNISLAEESVQRLTQHLYIVKAQFQEGAVTKSDVLRTEVELAQAKQNLSKAQNSCKLANIHLLTLLGLPLNQEISLSEPGTTSFYEGSSDLAIKIALLNRADLKQYRQNEKAALQNVKISQSGNLPTISLELKKDWPSQQNYTKQLSAQITVSFNVFDGGKTKSKISQANYELLKTNELFQQKAEQISLETQETYFNLQNSRTALDIASQVVNKAEEDYEIALVRYQAGIGTNLDVIDSQGALTSAKLNYANARYDYIKYNIQLSQAIGTIREDAIYDNQKFKY